MLSGRYFIYQEAPWGKLNNLSTKFLERGKEFLLQGKLEDASKVFTHIIDNRSKFELLEWAYLLRSYAYRLASFFGDARKKKLMLTASKFDYINAAQLNLPLAEQEGPGYGMLMIWLEHLVELNHSGFVKLRFEELQDQAWRVYLVDGLSYRGSEDAVITLATESLARLSSNHFLLFLRSNAWLQKGVDGNDLTLLVQADHDLTRAIQFSPKNENAQLNLSRYYFHRAQIRFMTKTYELMCDDFEIAMEYDKPDNDAFDKNFRLSMLNQMQVRLAMIDLSAVGDESQRLKIEEIQSVTAEIKNNISEIDLYIKRAKLCEDLQEWRGAAFDYAVAYWILKVGIKTSAKFSASEVKQKLQKVKSKLAKQSDLVDPLLQEFDFKNEELKTSSPPPKQLSAEEQAALDKKRAKRARQKKRDLEQDLQGLVYQMVGKAFEVAQENGQKQALLLASKEEVKVAELEHSGAALAKQVKEASFLSPFIDKIFYPSQVTACARSIMALPLPGAERIYGYGGVLRDTVLFNQRESFDYDLRTALPLAQVAGVLKEVFDLAEEPKVEFGIIQASFMVLNRQGEKKWATLSLSHSAFLANQDYSFDEALRQDLYELDFMQNAFIATIPATGSLCPIYYPLDWWDLYLAPTLEQLQAQLAKVRAQVQLSEAMQKMAVSALCLVGEGREYRVYFLVKGQLLKIQPQFKRELFLNLQLQEKDRALLLADDCGRVAITRENKGRLQELLADLNQACLREQQCTLATLKGKVAVKMELAANLETIQAAALSFRHDPIRQLRAVYLSASLGYCGFSQEVVLGIRNNLAEYADYLTKNSSKVNSWFNKMFCRSGKEQLITQMNHLYNLGLLDVSFPGLASLFANDSRLRRWMNSELWSASRETRPSLNYIYAVFVMGIAIFTGRKCQDVLQANALFAANYNSIDPEVFLSAAEASWANFLNQELAPIQLPLVNLQYMNMYASSPTMFSGAQQKANERAAPVPSLAQALRV